MPLVLGRQDALRHVAAAAGLGAGIPAAHHCTARNTISVDTGSQALSVGGSTPKAASREPKCASAAFATASSPPTDFTAITASTMTPPILTTNWKVSVTTTPQRPEKMV
jgi:hypothetical protein